MESIGPVLTLNIGSHFQFLPASSYNSPCIAAFLWFRFVARGPVTVHPLRPPDLPKMVARQMLLGIDKQVLFGRAAIGVYMQWCSGVCGLLSLSLSLSLPLIPTHKQSGLQWWLKYAHIQISPLSHTLCLSLSLWYYYYGNLEEEFIWYDWGLVCLLVHSEAGYGSRMCLARLGLHIN